MLSGTSPGSLGVTFPGGTFEGVIDALATDNLAHIVAEPTLTTLSGTQANFIVGGQFPVPVASSPNATTGITTVTVEFKNYGVQLSFTPTVFSDGRISLAVEGFSKAHLEKLGERFGAAPFHSGDRVPVLQPG